VAFRPLRSPHLKDLELSCLWRQGDASPILAAFLEVVRNFEHGVRGSGPRSA
jgi:hypothetical protein